MNALYLLDVPCTTYGRIEGSSSNERPIIRNHPRKCHPFLFKATHTAASSRIQVHATAQLTNVAEDKWINTTINETAPKSTLSQLSSLQSSCLAALSTMRMPTTKNEDYRFTDITPILQTTLQSPAPIPHDILATVVAQHQLKQSTAAALVVVDGVLNADLSSIDTDSLPPNTFIGSISSAPSDVVSFALGAQSRGRGGPFATLNGALVTDAIIVNIPADTCITKPIHILYISSSPSINSDAKIQSVSAPRVLLILEEGSTAEVIEEFTSAYPSSPTEQQKGNSNSGTSSSSSSGNSIARAGPYMCTAVAEIELDDRASLKHSYAALDAPNATHFKSTLVNQGKESSYSLTEIRIGGAITRHDLSVDQLGDATSTVMKSFLLAGQDQTHDLHSSLKLDHPDGTADQLHKCIAGHSTAKGVFDGNVRVNRRAQRTDAQQLSRNLLLTPRATVNVKPNLQIVADDVKCTHGCTVSDLEDEQMFYLRARGIDEESARTVLVYSFGREVVQFLSDEKLIDRVQARVSDSLQKAAHVVIPL